MRTITSIRITSVLVAALLLSGCAQQQLVKADKAYERMAYADATLGYEKVMQRSDERSVALRLADSYRALNKTDKAAQWYAYADRMNPLNGAEALAYGRTLQSLGRIAGAADLFQRVIAESPEDAVVRELGLAIADRDAFFEDTTLFTITPLNISGVTSAFSAIPYGNRIMFAGEREADASKANPWNGASFLDLYTASGGVDGNRVAEAVPGEVNGRFHDGPAVITSDGRTMYFTRSDYYKFRLNKDDASTSHLMLYRAERQADGSWGQLHSFAYNGMDFSAGHAALSKDGQVLYYISDMPGGMGGTDIYACERTEEGWGYPRNLGPTINTSANEMFPTVSGDTLFFSSNGHRSLGGLDIFHTTQVDGEWSKPVNMNYPINSTFDDFSLALLPGGRSGYLSSNRTGSDRIHSFQAHDPTLILAASFVDEETGRPMTDVEVRMLRPTEPEPLQLFTEEDGSIEIPLSVDGLYRLQGSKDGVFTESRDVSTVGQRTSRTYTEEFRMKRVVMDKPILIENIYYDYDRWDIRPDAAIELDKVARLFMDNPNLSFELGSHTDSRATDLYNLVLSDARAQSAVDYLIRKGVDPNRLTYKGYGERKLVNRCTDGVECTEDEHQANRRTEFKVTRIRVAPEVSEQR
ncbi:MAG: OmpA family protein [Flavobacteriales bacterium]|nr:OmpA family protein [Flavobacteriales bacterium]